MNNSSKKGGFNTDVRSLLKHQHKKVYSICRLFAHNYKEHQRLFIDIIAAASQNIRTRRENSDKQTLLLRACVNMAALHSIALELESETDRSIQFKSPDYQRSMSQFRESVGEVSDYEKFRLFLEFEHIPAEELANLTGITPRNRVSAKKKEVEPLREEPRKNFSFIPYLKEKLVWN